MAQILVTRVNLLFSCNLFRLLIQLGRYRSAHHSATLHHVVNPQMIWFLPGAEFQFNECCKNECEHIYVELSYKTLNLVLYIFLRYSSFVTSLPIILCLHSW